MDFLTVSQPTSNFQLVPRDFAADERPLADDQDRHFTLHGKDDDEKLAAMCEAGFVTDCRISIERARAAASNQDEKSKTHMESTKSLSRPPFGKTEDHTAYRPSFPAYGLFVILAIALLVRSIHRG
ncbi:hypothetical protein N7468_001746 [Penicillium chermesinum]|uniref:Uncharacterized protein n=1 Tax=Penicillium chermesinum TaxID=63820 RepID=A0A9W9PJC3_9EURO|nr:uncharacterized protein N7468_001746 [Penicillium chermesinum]KAJ5246763.1 hypothetical protein N7468_001746 [Penicillium chermesinum]KAJ6145028.1 hypothetical protein N7470_008923 [Penicillium chermesinum]